ncbi:MAG: NAD(P)-binding domain-containing protein [Acidobacteria bacterium]|nr:NAD(P)-binding domain-containing protein [Acidobacteriota bacterium]
MTATPTRFVIKRKDLYEDDLVLELDGLAIGSALGSDLLLNHPTVSRIHAGIREIDESFWLTNLSKSNGTLVNGALIETIQIQPGDTIQIGIFLIRPAFDVPDQIILEIDRQIDSVSAGNRAAGILGNPIQAAAEGKTIKLDPSLFAFLDEITSTGSLTGQLQFPGQTQQLKKDGKTTQEIEMERQGTQKLTPQPQQTQQLQMKTSGSTARMATMRLQRGQTGMLTALAGLSGDEQKKFQESIDTFWERRKQAEQGEQKLADISALRPQEPDPELAQYNLHLGKKQFNWLPSFDLVRPWPRGYLYVFGGTAILAMLLAAVFYEKAYSPGEVSNPHNLPLAQQPADVNQRVGAKIVANIAAENNCAACHSPVLSMQKLCMDCHQTAHFNPEVISAHQKANVGCVDCHTEHKGKEFKPAGVARSMCIDCHRDDPRHPKAHDAKGQLLKNPHPNTAGYPVNKQTGQWTWTNPLNPKWKQVFPANIGPKEKFHLVHGVGLNAAGEDWKCSGCHEGFTPAAKAKVISEDKCSVCHGATYDEESKRKLDQLAANFKLDCNSCHPQHGYDTVALASLKKAGKDRTPIVWTPEGVYRGGKDWQWTSFAAKFGGMSVNGWLAFFSILPLTALGFLVVDSNRRRNVLTLLKGNIIELSRKKVKFNDITYAKRWESKEQIKRAEEAAKARPVPQPVINYETCIGCHNCILACPQDVLGFDDQEHHAIVVNYEQCMEDTGCQQACPTVPQSCVLINTKKKIREAPKPIRKGINDGYETEHAAGVYLVGDVSGVPLIRNAIKEGRAAMDKIADRIQTEGRAAGADYDVAIIGIGPGGISATARAAERNLTYVALEQGRKYSTIADKYPAGKYVAFNPYNPGDPELGTVKLEGPGDLKEKMLAWWDEAVDKLGLKINEYEGCKEIAKEGDIFVIKTEKNPAGYRVRKVVLALGTAGEPRKLGCPGEDLKAPDGKPRVVNRLQDPSVYKGKNIVVVGAGNSAVEAAVDLTGKRQDDGTVGFPKEGANQVALVVRSDFPKDLTLENKMWVYYCIDRGKIKAYFGAGIKEITETEVSIEKIRDKSEIVRMPNDVVFAMIGSIAPKEFLSKIGIKYAGDDRKK